MIIDKWRENQALATVRQLPRGSGILVLCRLGSRELRRLRHLARLRELDLLEECIGGIARVHDMKELRAALEKRTALLFVSPIHPTKTHPGWPPLSRMRAATFARLASRKAYALGGMDERRFSRIKQLGFKGWAGVSAFRT